MPWRTIPVTVALCAVVASAQATDNWNRWYDFRHVSGLAGNGFPVTPDGEIRFGGAIQQNVPVGYTPHSGEYLAGYWSGSNNSSISVGIRGSNVNGTGLLALGFGSKKRAFFYSYVLADADLRQAYHLQAQLLTEEGGRPAVSIGVLDMFDMRQKTAGIGHGARSFYLTATRRFGEEQRPLYATLGVGTGRFGDGPFGGVSWNFAPNWAGILEYDGLNPNIAVAWSLHGHNPDAAWDVTALLGWSGFERPVIGVAGNYRR